MSWATLDPARQQLAQELLTNQQVRILKHRLDGHSYRTIGLALHIHESTVRYHWKRTLDILEHALEKDPA